MNAHELGRLLLAGPDLPVGYDDNEWGWFDIGGTVVSEGRVTFIDPIDAMPEQDRAAYYERQRQESFETKTRNAAIQDAMQEVDF